MIDQNLAGTDADIVDDIEDVTDLSGALPRVRCREDRELLLVGERKLPFK